MVGISGGDDLFIIDAGDNGNDVTLGSAPQAGALATLGLRGVVLLRVSSVGPGPVS